METAGEAVRTAVVLARTKHDGTAERETLTAGAVVHFFGLWSSSLCLYWRWLVLVVSVLSTVTTRTATTTTAMGDDGNGQTGSVDPYQTEPLFGCRYPLCCHLAQQKHVIWGRQRPQYFFTIENALLRSWRREPKLELNENCGKYW
jgi:hypothetical protein